MVLRLTRTPEGDGVFEEPDHPAPLLSRGETVGGALDAEAELMAVAEAPAEAQAEHVVIVQEEEGAFEALLGEGGLIKPLMDRGPVIGFHAVSGRPGIRR